MYRFLVITTLLVVLALVTVLAISSAQPRPDVVLINGAEVHNLDPAKMSWMHDIRTAYGLWEGLLSMNPRTLAPEPAVARDYNVSADGKTYTFYLRPEARWSNGDPVTAEDFRFAWLRVLDPATAADYYTYMFLIEGAQAYYDARKAQYESSRQPRPAGSPKKAQATQPDERTVAIRALDKRTLRVRLVRPALYFAELLAFATFLPVHRASMDKFLVHPPGQPPFYDPDWLKPANLVTNGPFTLARWDFQYRLVLVRNENYWDKAHVASRRIELLANPEVKTAFLAYESGSADVLTNLPDMVGPELIDQARQGKRPDLHIFPVWGTYYYRFNCKQAPLDDARVRKALAMCVDRKTIVERITRRGERPQTSFITPGLSITLAPGRKLSSAAKAGPGWQLSDDGKTVQYRPADGLDFDPPAARKLLAEAGYGPGGKPFLNGDGRKVTLLMNDSAEHRPIAEAVAKMWRDYLGIEVALEVQDSNIAGSRMKEHKFDLCRSGWYTDYGDPTGFLLMFRKADGNNDGQFDNPPFDELLDQADTTADPAARYELLHRAERILVADQAGVIPIYQYVGQFMYRRDIQGIWGNPKQQIMLKCVGKEK